ncbi:MAG: ABC transporter substrate-binding protein [Actinomycetota bacterium]|nr:ABC transporter substrate-binding protein [Actinomycetota bacterium]
MNETSKSGFSDLPSGTVTFLFTDIEASTRLERELRERYSEVLSEHRRLLREAFERYGGREVDTQGDSFFVVFPRARDAVAAAVAAQRALVEHTWPDGRQVRVRIGMHTGEASLDDGRYVGLAVHRGARISAAGHGGQILLSSSTCDVVEDDLPAGQRLVDLGENRLKDLPRPERVFQLLADGLPTEFPPLKTVDEQELAEAAQVLPTLPWWQRRRLLVALAGIAAVTAIAASVLVFTLGSDAGATEIGANALGLIDADGEAIDTEIPVDAAPTSVARGEGAIWVTNANDGTVSRIDPVTRSVRQTVTVGSSPSGIAVGAGAVWVANHFDGTVSRIDPETNTVVDTTAVGNGPTAVAFGEGSVWVTNSFDRTVSRIDPASGRLLRTIKTDAVGRGLAVGGGSVWVTDESSRSVMRLDPETNAVAETISVGNGPTGIAFGERAVWVANSRDGTVSRIDPATAAVTTTLAVPGGPGAVAAGGGAVWVSAEFAQRLARIDPDPADPKVVGEVEIGNRPKGVVVSEDGVWVAVQASGRGHRGGRLIAISGPFDSIDPQIANLTSSAYAGSLVYDGLTGFRRAGGSEGTQLVPNLATAIPDARDGGRSYTFRLRPGIRYSDGRRVRPEDFRRALERAYELRGFLVDLATAVTAVLGGDSCSKGRGCDLSRGVVTTGDTVTFRLSRPAPLFLVELSSLYPVPPATPSRDVGTKPVAGTGPYAIESYVPGRQVKLVRNPHFRVWSEAARPDAYPDEIVFRFDDLAQGVTAVSQGKADVLVDGVPPEEIEEVRVRYSRQLHVEPQRATMFLFLDTTQPPFRDIRVRRAVNYAIDRRRLVELGGGPALRQPTCQVIPPTVPGYVRYCPYTLDPRSTGEWTAPDVAKAQQLIAASGTRGQKVTVWTWPEFGKEGRYVVSLLRRLGYRTRLKELKDIDVYFHTIFDPKTRPQSGIMGWFGAQYGSQAIDTLRCGFSGNPARFCDRGIDEKAARALNLFATEPEGAVRMWAQLDRELVAQAPWVPLFNPRSPLLASKRVGNWQYHPYLNILLDQLWVR